MLRLLVCSLCCLTFLAGCSKKLTFKERVPVKGKVLFANGDPVRWARIDFMTTDLNVGANASGEIKDDGSFQLRTYGTNDYDGAVPGSYIINIDAYDLAVMGPLPANANAPTPIPKGATEGVTVEIKGDGDNQDLKITLKK